MTTLLGLIGYPISYTLSPAMHNAAAHALGIDATYLRLPVHPDQVQTAVLGAKALGFRGINVTIPHKQAVLPLVDELDPSAEAIGAVNTLIFDEDGIKGTNTDWSGFIEDLDSMGIGTYGRNAIILGAGGSARAIVYALTQRLAKVHIYARRLEQAQALADAFPPAQAHSLSDLPHHTLLTSQPTAPLIINTTPLGQTPHTDKSPWPHDLPLPDNAFVYDLVYSPAETTLMKQAKTAGLDCSNGLGMLVRQGAHAFKLWTGQDPDLQVMADTITQLPK